MTSSVSASTDPASVENGRAKIVYILDDDEAVRDSTSVLLESYGIATLAFGSPREFLKAFDPNQACCLLIDQHMPDMSGLEVFTLLQSRGVTTPVIVISGRSDAELDSLLIRSGAMATLRKPANNEAILQLVRTAMARGDKA